MTREDCIKRLEAVEDDYYRGIRQFTIDIFDEDINDICNEEYINNEEEANNIKEYLLNPANEFKVDKVNKKENVIKN